ncbi:Thiosulfate sulfurtransferase/rhodanese domain-containing protein 3 [Fasciolopsis buskii]|uniref:Thiosulfate sulfurtransferase/rhodanese domain-containing protein 3 n=1 Tax=Fasciolopsis buskii TaxID=27845 RepID=A0A8E0S4P1_9TREM|nr:Thiosulfate sulfurtransferase/rhodanese domain-containing protein 3 [Fasciolopsis buski]
MFRKLLLLGSAAIKAPALFKHHRLAAQVSFAAQHSCSRLFSSKSQGAAKLEEKIIEVSPGKRMLNYSELCALINKGDVLLIDVRDVSDFSGTGHITGAINIPLTELKAALKMTEEAFREKYGVKKPKPSDDNIVFYGLSDVLSAAASEIAHNMGYKK